MENEKKNRSTENLGNENHSDHATHREVEVAEGAVVEPENHEKAAMAAITSAQRDAELAQKEMLYLRAEFENYKKRMIRDQSESIRNANKNLLSDLVGFADLLDRALSHADALKSRPDSDIKNFVSGIEMTRNELTQLLSRFGVEFVGSVGEKFDPERHEAISQQDTTDDKVDTVLQVFQKGSLFHGKLLRPARVVVGKK